MTRGPIQLDVGVSYAIPRTGLPAAVSFRRWVAAALQGRILRADLAVRLVGEREGRALNLHYRGQNHATNVLSFPADLPHGVTLPLLGDIVLCAPVIAREARTQGKELNAHYAHLTSAIWMAFRAAPLRMLSDEIHMAMPFGSDMSSRMRPT